MLHFARLAPRSSVHSYLNPSSSWLAASTTRSSSDTPYSTRPWNPHSPAVPSSIVTPKRCKQRKHTFLACMGRSCAFLSSASRSRSFSSMTAFASDARGALSDRRASQRGRRCGRIRAVALAHRCHLCSLDRSAIGTLTPQLLCCRERLVHGARPPSYGAPLC